jgi:methylenetetrahydrofolate reductase (NADPH)
MTSHPFQVICEIQPPTVPDLKHVRHQIGTLAKVADGFLIPDNHIGRATVSSVAVARVEAGDAVAAHGLDLVRDRNLLGFRRDLLTAAAYGVGQFLFIYGDKPSSGGRTSDLTVRAMIEEARGLPGDAAFAGIPPFRLGTAAALRPLPAWKRAADFMFAQVSFSLDALLRWREANPVDVPVYAGVMVIASANHARMLAAAIPDIEIPGRLVDQVTADRRAGVAAACEYVTAIRESGAFDGVHLIPVARYREVAAQLEDQLRTAP